MVSWNTFLSSFLEDLEDKIVKMMRYSYNFTMQDAGETHALLKRGVQKGLKSVGRQLKHKGVFSEDYIFSKEKIFDPQDKFLQFWNRVLILSCLLAISCDPLFFYLPHIHPEDNCFGIQRRAAARMTTVRTCIDVFYILRIVFQFRTAFVAPSSRVFGRGELVTDPTEIAKRYIRRGVFFVDVLSILPLPQFVLWRNMGYFEDVKEIKKALLSNVLVQYIPRIIRIFPLASELKRTVGVFVESAFLGAIYYLLLSVLSGHIVGSFWYLLGLHRNEYCWLKACEEASDKCNKNDVYCSGHLEVERFNITYWRHFSATVLEKACSGEINVDDTDDPSKERVEFGIYTRALETGLYSRSTFRSKFFYCLWWGLQNLSTVGQGLETSMWKGEVCFSIIIALLGLFLFALLIGNMQTYLQSLTLRIEEMRLKRRDAEQWMHHRGLPQDLRDRVRRYDEYRWMETRGVDEQNLVQSLPKDLRRDIKRHLCLALVRRVPIFEKMDEQLLDAICERLKQSLYTEKSYIVREGDPVDEMLFIIRGRLESVTTDGGRTGFYNRSLLRDGDFCGDELLTWSLDPKTGTHLPLSTRTVKSLSEVEAFAISAEEMKFVASQFRRLHSRQVQHTFRYHSMQWRTWAASYIQASWRRFTKRKMMELLSMQENEGVDENSIASSALGTTILASRFARNALRGVHKLRDSASASELVNLQKPPEPDFESSQ